MSERFTEDNPLTIVGWLWQNPDCITQYVPEHANIWARMIDRKLGLPHRFVLATDYPRERWVEFDPLIEPLELWDDWRSLKNEVWGVSRPHCYVRLKAFSREFGEMLAKLPVQKFKSGEAVPSEAEGSRSFRGLRTR
jgi:hypothetical protein